MMRRENGTATAAEEEEKSCAFAAVRVNGCVKDTVNPGSIAVIPVFSCSSSSTSSPPSSGLSYIEHRVSKMDTLAGIAIKYGVEVADIKRMNGLVTDLQMFALKSLQIPLPGRHPPSPILSNGLATNGEHSNTPLRSHNDVLSSFQSLKLKDPPCEVSPAMSSLHGYYGLTPPKKGPTAEGTEMAVYNRTGNALNFEDDLLYRKYPLSAPLAGQHRKSRSLANRFTLESVKLAEAAAFLEVGENSDTEKLNGDSSVRRRQKVEAEIPSTTPEMLLKEESSTSGFPGRTGKGLALRPKSGSRTDIDMGGKAAPLATSSIADGLFAVRKSSSTSNLQESENSSSMWPSTRWTLNSDAIARPIFDGLPKPISGRRKAALD